MAYFICRNEKIREFFITISWISCLFASAWMLYNSYKAEGKEIFMKKVDERDIMFSRLGYLKGTPIYDEYYKEHPDKKGIDDMLRSRTGFGEPGTVAFDEIRSPVGNSGFEFLSDIKHLADKKTDVSPKKLDKRVITDEIKKWTRYFGADLVGIAEVRSEHYYTHRGRPEAVWGQVVDEKATYVIVFAVEMDEEMIKRAPEVEVAIEGVKSYVNSAVIGLWLAYYIRSFGYSARTHMDGNYLGMVQKMAVDAGLGEIGKSGLLLTRKFGSRVRLGAVTTDLPLFSDDKDEMGVESVCMKCMRCVEKCPSKAIPEGGKVMVDGQMEWPAISPEKCYMVWSRMGTDCGLCISECPFSKGISELLLKKSDESSETLKKLLAEE